jgi:uncharacterized membrane protein YhaH (DUF805 family)
MKFLFSPNGRIGRLAWWGGQLASVSVVILISVAIIMITAFLAAGGVDAGGGAAISVETDEYAPSAGGQAMSVAVSVLLSLVAIWISFCITVKRYHDRNKSGFWYLIVLVPIIGPIWQIIECGFFSGDVGPNDYGQPGGSAGAQLSAGGTPALGRAGA